MQYLYHRDGPPGVRVPWLPVDTYRLGVVSCEWVMTPDQLGHYELEPCGFTNYSKANNESLYIRRSRPPGIPMPALPSGTYIGAVIASERELIADELARYELIPCGRTEWSREEFERSRQEMFVHHFDHVAFEERMVDDGSRRLVVETIWKDVDHASWGVDYYLWPCSDRKFIKRLEAAMSNPKNYDSIYCEVDEHGFSFIRAVLPVAAMYLDRDLKRLGY
jgi:hypothetical protein